MRKSYGTSVVANLDGDLIIPANTFGDHGPIRFYQDVFGKFFFMWDVEVPYADIYMEYVRAGLWSQDEYNAAVLRMIDTPRSGLRNSKSPQDKRPMCAAPGAGGVLCDGAEGHAGYHHNRLVEWKSIQDTTPQDATDEEWNNRLS